MQERSSAYEANSNLSKRVRQSTRALLDLVPRNFSQKYRNPCWLSSVHIPHTLSQYFKTLRAIRTPLTSDNASISDTVIKDFNSTQFMSVLHCQIHQRTLFCLPQVYIAAFPKCGTTALYYMLKNHPLVATSLRKEGHFWSTFTEASGTYTDKLLHSLWYLHQFQVAARKISKSPKSITIDASPSTLWRTVHELESESDALVLPSVIHELTPTARFIVIMRDPVKRLFSDFWFFCSNQNWVRKNGRVVVPDSYIESGRQIFHNLTAEAINSFHSCVVNSAVSVFYECVRRASIGSDTSKSACFPLRLGIGMYYYHIQHWMQVFSREQFLFLRSEDLLLTPYQTMKKVWNFLSFAPQTELQVNSFLAKKHGWNTNEWIKEENYREKFKMLPETKKMLREFYRPHNEKLVQLLSDSHYLWDDDATMD